MSSAGLRCQSGSAASRSDPAGQAPRAATPASPARAEASRRNGARSRGPKTSEGKERSARNALKHGLRAQKYVVLPSEDAAAFRALESALIAELAPEDAMQDILVGRIAAAAWRLERAERLEVEVFEVRGYGGAAPGVTLIRDGNGTRSIETVMRYRNAALAELSRALRTLKTLQAEAAKAIAPAGAAARRGRALEQPAAPTAAAPAPADRTATPAPEAKAAAPASKRRASTTTAAAAMPDRRRPNEPERATALRLDYALPDTAAPDRTLHEAAAGWMPNETRTGPGEHVPATGSRPDEPEAFPPRPIARN